MRSRLRWFARATILGTLLLIGVGCASLTPGKENRSSAFTRPATVEPSVTTGSRPSSASRSGAVTPSRGGSAIVTTATSYVGTPYVWGGSNPVGFDCSGFVKHVYGEVGVTLPRTVREQYRIGSSVARDRLRAGDLVFFDRLRHNGIYIGNNQVIHASKPGDTVKISALDEAWFKKRWVGARRVL